MKIKVLKGSSIKLNGSVVKLTNSGEFSFRPDLTDLINNF